MALEPKAFEVLLFLLENPGRLIGKRELLDRVWPDTVVTESAMTRVIADLRRALGDAAREGRYIETVPTKGYRFIAEIRRPETPSPPQEGSAPRVRPAVWLAGGVLALVLGLGTFLALRPARPRPAALPPPAPAKLTQLTNSLGSDLFPSFSPDGAAISYCSDRDGTFEVYVRQLAPGGREIRITSDGHDNVQPAWSPDGRQIAYTSRAEKGVWLVPALGGEPHRLTTFGARPSWSPDGATIAFQSGAPVDFLAAGPAAVPPSSLWLVPAGGGEPMPLTRPGSPVGGHGAPAFSPDGAEVVFVVWSGGAELWSVSVRDGSLRRILPQRKDAAEDEGPSNYQYFDPVVSPKGDFLYFAATHDRYLHTNLWRLRAPAGRGGPWGAPEPVTPDGTSSVRHIAISPRTGTVAYAALSLASNLWSLPLDPKTSLPAGGPVPLTRAAGFRMSLPRFSQDGSTIAFLSSGAGTSVDIFTIGRDGGEARPLTEGAGAHILDWFPSGDRIAFFTVRNGKKGLWAVAREDRSQRRLLELAEDVLVPRLSRDGTLVAYTKSAPDVAVWVQPLKGGAPRRLTPPDAVAYFPCWSPDGRTLAVEVLRSPDVLLAVIPATGGIPTILVGEKGLSWPSDWSPDGEKIAFAGQRDGLWNLYWVARSGGAARRLTENKVRRAFLRYPAWSPQGDRIVYEYGETTGNIYLLDPAR